MLMEFDQVRYTYPCTNQPALNDLSLNIFLILFDNSVAIGLISESVVKYS